MLVSPAAPRLLTDGQLRAHLVKLEAERQYDFLRFSYPLFEQQSDIYLTALAQSRSALAQALAQIKVELGSDDEDDDQAGDEDNNGPMGASKNLFDTSTEIGKHMAAISYAFTDLLQATEKGDAKLRRKAERADAKAMKDYLKTMEESQTALKEPKTNKEKRPRSGKKKKKTRRPVEGTMDQEVLDNLKANLATDLSTAAKEEQESIMKKMKTHGKSIDKERKRQKEKLNERIRSAHGKRMSGAGSAYAEAVDNLMDRKNELDDIHHQDRVRQENALKDRLKHRKRMDSVSQSETDSMTQISGSMSTLVSEAGAEEGEFTDSGSTTTVKKKSKPRSKVVDLGDAEEQIESNADPVSIQSSQVTVNELEESDQKAKRKKSKKLKQDMNGSDGRTATENASAEHSTEPGQS